MCTRSRAQKGGYCLTQGAEGDEVTISAVGDECSGSHDVEPRLLFCYSVVMTRRDETVRRGAVMRSLAVCSPYQFLDLFHVRCFSPMSLTVETRIIVLFENRTGCAVQYTGEVFFRP
jgi:hypothetical protein